MGVGATVCTNPSGWQEWKSVGTHYLYDPWDAHYQIGSTISPWQIY
jgi:hypothetical protein